MYLLVADTLIQRKRILYGYRTTQKVYYLVLSHYYYLACFLGTRVVGRDRLILLCEGLLLKETGKEEIQYQGNC